MIFDIAAETMGIDERKKIQLSRLRKMVDYCYNNVPFYKKKLGDAGINSGADIRTLEDIRYIPFTTKQDLKDNYPDGFLAVPMKKIARIHASSGTTGKPTVGYYTQNDMKLWRSLAARVLALNGITEDDVFQLSVSYGLFTGAFGFHQGAELIGCTIVPASAGNTEKQLVMLHDMKVTAITATPSYAALLSEKIKNSGNLSEYNLKRVLFGAERCSDKIRSEVEANLGVVTADNYGLTECFGPGVAGECEAQNGLHISEDFFYPEIVNAEGVSQPDGVQGELVFTSLEREAMPLLRYKTRDITILDHTPCSCGRTTVRMHAPFARTDDMFVFKGINVFPGQIECAMAEVAGISPHYHVTLTRNNYIDNAVLSIELERSKSTYSADKLAAIEAEINRKLKEIVIVRMNVELLEPESLERSNGKTKRVSDLRYDE